MTKPLIRDEGVRDAEVAVILSGFWVDREIMDYRTLLRLQRGIELYRQGRIKKIICLGGLRLPADPAFTIAEGMKRVLIRYGVAEEDIFQLSETSRTYDDLISLKERYGLRFDLNKALFITSSYHTTRVRLFLDQLGIAGTVVSAYPVEIKPVLWSLQLDQFREIVREYLAIAYYLLNGVIKL
ncbi:MAG: YdcF family protein [Magnetococcales bacterium]|nr:YdcF family protein [Magnetococcales bacterium]